MIANPALHLPDQFIATVQRVFGARGREWLPKLPAIIAQCREKWRLHDNRICPNMSMNYIEFAVNDAGPVALKVGVPHTELFTEMAALQVFAGRGAVRLLDTDMELGAILMQRVIPGTMLWELGDNIAATRIAASIMQRLAAPVPEHHSFPSFGNWVEMAFRLTRTAWDPQGLMPRSLLDRAEEAFRYIEQAKQGDVVLHGDLHHENIVKDEQVGWVAIDPKGVVGAHCLEVGRYLQNQLPENLTAAERERVVRDRVAIFSSELGYSEQMVLAAGLVDCVLGHCWCFEDEVLGSNWREGIELGELYCRLLDM